MLAATTGAALAQADAPAAPAKARAPLDTNQDGVIDRTEAAAHPRLAARFDTLDKNKDGAMRFISFATDPARLAAQAQLIAYGPMRKSALDLVGKHPVIDVEMREFLPTSPDNFKKALKIDDAWWKTHGAELTKRFEEWRAAASPGDGKPVEPTLQQAAPDSPPPQAAP